MSESHQKPITRRRSSLWADALRQPKVWRRAIFFGLPIGILQAVINQGDFWLHHQVSRMVLARSILSPLVTFSAALISAAATHMDDRENSKTRLRFSKTEKSNPPISSAKNAEMILGDSRNYDRIEI